jgi:major capsid protein E
MLDIFRSDAFSVTSLTDAILKAPFKPGRIGALGLFRERGITTTSVVIEEKDGRLSLIQTSPRGAPSSSIGESKRTARSFLVPHLSRESTVMADEVQNVRAFGSQDATAAVQAVVNERLQDLRAMHEVTLEHLRAGAIKGLILDADGSTLLNLFTEFGVSQQSAVLTPDAAADNGDQLRGQIVAIQRLIEAELGAEPVSSYRAFCGKDFMDDLRADLGVVQTLRYADPQALLQQQANARMFSFGGVTWEEYRGSTGGTPFIPDAEAYVFPEGSPIFSTYFAPADFVETVNTVGLPIYAKQAPDAEFNRFVKIHSQSNPLSLCLRPRAVVKATLGT